MKLGQHIIFTQWDNSELMAQQFQKTKTKKQKKQKKKKKKNQNCNQDHGAHQGKQAFSIQFVYTFS